MWTDWGPNALITSPSLSPFFCPIQKSTNSLIQFGAAWLEFMQRQGAPAANVATSFIRQPTWFIYYHCVFPLCLLITSWGWDKPSEILMRVSPRGGNPAESLMLAAQSGARRAECKVLRLCFNLYRLLNAVSSDYCVLDCTNGVAAE